MQNYSFPAVKVTGRAPGSACGLYFFFVLFFFNCHFNSRNNITDESTCARAGLRAAVPVAGDSAQNHQLCGEQMSGRSTFRKRVPGGRSAPGTVPRSSFREPSGLCPAPAGAKLLRT